VSVQECDLVQTEDEARNNKIGRCVDGAGVMKQESMHRPCFRMVYAYDRDSTPFYFPKDVGVRLGPGSPYTRMVQEWHYLLPKAGIHHKFTDKTRFKLMLTNKLRPHNAAIIAQMDMRMTLPPGHAAYHHSFRCTANKMQSMLKTDFAKFGHVKPFAVHLHSHMRGKRLWWDHMRNGKKIGELGRFDHYGGYGPDQSFVHLDASLNTQKIRKGFTFVPGTMNETKILPGDELINHCVFDTSDAPGTIVYGTNHGEEMCGNILMYYPHDWRTVKHHEDGCLGGG